MNNDDFIKRVDSDRQYLYGYDKSLLDRKITYKDLQDVEENLQPAQFNIDLQGYHWECLFQRGEGKNLYVIYDGAREGNFPGFPRWGYYRLFSGCMLSIEDPMYYLYPDIRLGWYYGTKQISLIEISLEIVRAVCRHEDIHPENIIFFSSSGGGYAGIYAACLMEVPVLAIALNPQIYIYDYNKRQYEYFHNSLGIDLRSYDSLGRNNIYPLIRNSKSKFVLLFNAHSKEDWENHLLPFAKELGITPAYGLVQKDNVLLWVYEAVGLPRPHVSFETKAIFIYLDFIAKKFYSNMLTEQDKKNVFSINECWREIYRLRKDVQKYKENIDNFMFLGNEGGVFKPPYNRGSAKIVGKDGAWHYVRIYNLDKANTIYTIALNKVRGSASEYTAGFYDFTHMRILHFEKCKVTEPKVFHCMTGPQPMKVAFVIYAGIAGKTQGQWLIVEEILISNCPLGGGQMYAGALVDVSARTRWKMTA